MIGSDERVNEGATVHAMSGAVIRRVSLKRVACLVSVVMAAMVLSIGLPAAGTAAGPERAVRADQLAAMRRAGIPRDPYTGGTGQHRTEVEPSAAAEESTVVTAFQVGRNVTGGAEAIGFARSGNNGHTWAGGILPHMTLRDGGPWVAASDPSVAYDARHQTWLVAALEGDLSKASAVAVSRSTDNGHTWSAPSYADKGNKRFWDKEWIACDNNVYTSHHFGTCYLTWDDGFNGHLFMQRSIDGGRTWSRPVEPKSDPLGSSGEQVAQPDGRVVEVYDSPGGLSAVVSIDGGATWSAPKRIADLNTAHVPVRADASASVAVGERGRIFAVWPGCPSEPCSADHLLMSTSNDGRTWSKPARIPTGPAGGTSVVLPAIAVDPTQRDGGPDTDIAITYYRISKPRADGGRTLSVEAVTSGDGGAQWARSRVLAKGIDTRWLAQTSSGPMVGDYIGEAFGSDGNAVSVFVTATPPENGLLQERVATHTLHIN